MEYDFISSGEWAERLGEKHIVLSTIDKLQFYMKPYNKSNDDIFRTNIIPWMLLNPTMDKKKWPQPTKCVISTEPEGKMILDFYDQLRSNMLSEYISFMEKNGHMQTYAEISKFKNLIDVTKQLDEPPAHKVGYPIANISEESIANLRKLGWKCFLPCYDEFVIKLTKWRYLYVKKENVRPEKRSFELYIEEYAGSRREWMILAKTKVQLNFGTPNDDGLEMGWNILDIHTLEEIVTEFVPSMNWSKQKQTFWCDLFGYYGVENTTIVRCYEPDEEKENKASPDSYFDITLTNKEAINCVARSKLIPDGYASIFATGESAIAQYHDVEVESNIKCYLNTICGIMVSVCSQKNKPTKNEDGNWVIDSIVFISDNDKAFQDWLFGQDIRGKLITE